jgi:hypothetical protein
VKAYIEYREGKAYFDAGAECIISGCKEGAYCEVLAWLDSTRTGEPMRFFGCMRHLEEVFLRALNAARLLEGILDCDITLKAED